MIASILALTKSVRFWMQAGAVVGVLFAGWKVLDTYYDRGYAAAEMALMAQLEEMRQENDKLRRANENLARAVAEETIRVEERIVERVRTVEREIPVVVEKVVPAQCRDLGPDVLRLFNDAIRAGGGEGSVAGDPGESPAAMPFDAPGGVQSARGDVADARREHGRGGSMQGATRRAHATTAGPARATG